MTERLSEEEAVVLAEDTRKAARKNFLGFTAYTAPWYRINWHHRLIAKKLQRVALGLCLRLIICAPPQTGKSELVSRRLPPFILGNNPDARVICTSNTAGLATKMSRDAKSIILSREYQELFPETRISSQVGKRTPEIETADEWDIVGRRGGLFATGRGGNITGRPASDPGDIAIVDDPIKGAEEARSKVIRDNAWDWFNDEVLMRLGSAGACILMHTRWNEDDLVGRVLKRQAEARKRHAENPDEPLEEEPWEFLNLAALREPEGDPDDPREEGDSLWPWFYSGKRKDLSKEEEEARARRFLKAWEKRAPYGFASLGQQRPVPRGGKLFPIEKIEIIRATDRRRVKTVRYWDNAGTKDAGCYTAGGKMSKLDNGKFLIEHMARGQWGANEREAKKKAQAALDGGACTTYVEQEPGSSGKDVAEYTIANLAGNRVKADKVTGSKEARAEPFADQVQGGNVMMLEGIWNQDLLDELAVWPRGTYKDQGDALSGAFSKLAGKGYSLEGMGTPS